MVEMVVPMENLTDPMDIRFTFKVTNLDDITIYVKSELISPPAGWNGSGEEHGALGVGVDDYFLNDNYTRDKIATDTEETVTLRIGYYSDALYSSLMTYDDITYTITYVDFTDGSYTILDDDGFEVDMEDWSGFGFQRGTIMAHTGVGSLWAQTILDTVYVQKDFIVPSATRAYIRVWVQWTMGVASFQEGLLEVITDLNEVSQKRTLNIAMDYAPLGGSALGGQWLCFGLKMPTNGTYRVRLKSLPERCGGAYCKVYYDDIRVVYS